MGFLSGITDAIFGKSPSASMMAPAQMDTMSPEQKQLMNKLISYYSGYADKNADPYAGSRVAELSPMTNWTLGNLQSSLPMYNQMFSGLMPMATGETSKPSYMMDYWNENIKKPAVADWQDTIIPGIRGSSAKRGLFLGSGRERAEQTSAQNLLESLDKSRTSTLMQMEQQGRQNQFQSGQLLSNLLQNQTLLGLQGGDVLRNVEQKKLDSAYDDWLRTQPGSRPQDTMLQSLLKLQPYTYGGTPVVNQGSSGLLSNIMSGWAGSAGGSSAINAGASALGGGISSLIGLLGGGGMFFSSKRWKKNITNIDNALELVNKLNPVDFEWDNTKIPSTIGEGKTRGLIAEDVEKVAPDLVVKDKYGDVLGVKYNELVPILLGAVKELTAKVEALEQKGGKK